MECSSTGRGDRKELPIGLIAFIAAWKGALTVAKLAEILGVSEQLLYKLVDAGIIPSYRIGSAIRLWPAEVADYLRTHRIFGHKPALGRKAARRRPQ